jgi:GNAT superfamily N-acetyltransferase
MTDAVIIRSARPSDVPRLVDLLIGGALVDSEDPTDLSPYEQAFRDIGATEGTDILVAERRGEVLGMCQVIVFRHLQGRGGRCAEVESVHVDASERSNGIGRMLMAEAVNRARAAGCYRVQLTSNKVRVDAHRFYMANGFTASHEGFKLDLAD